MASPFTHSQLVALAVIPHFTGFLSVAGNAYIIQDVLKDSFKRSRTYCRLLLGMSVFNTFASGASAFATWPIPSNEPTLYASGTTATCTAQGFFIQLGSGMIIYTVGLTAYYYLILVQKWPDWRLKKKEMYVHALAWVMGLGSSIIGLALKLYNNANLWCWISSLPQTCEGGNYAERGMGPCKRGHNAWIYRWALLYGPIFLAIFCHTTIMARVSWFVFQTEKKSRKYRHASATQKRQDKLQSVSSQVFWQSFHYVLVFYLTWIFPSVMRMQETLQVDVSAVVIFGMCICAPLQGFLNFLLYLRPRFLNHGKTLLKSFTSSVTSPALSDRLGNRLRLKSGTRGSTDSKLPEDLGEEEDQPPEEARETKVMLGTVAEEEMKDVSFYSVRNEPEELSRTSCANPIRDASFVLTKDPSFLLIQSNEVLEQLSLRSVYSRTRAASHEMSHDDPSVLSTAKHKIEAAPDQVQDKKGCVTFEDEEDSEPGNETSGPVQYENEIWV